MSHAEKPSLRSRAVSAVVWVGIGQFGSQGIHYLVLLVLAWLLPPADFGLAGLAMLFIRFTQAVGELGLGAAIVQQKEADEPMLSTAFWANLVMSLLMAGVTFLGAGVITNFLGDNSATPLLRGLSIIHPITALAAVPRASLEKQLSFSQISVRDLASELAFGVVGLVLAAAGAGVWSLVGATVAQRLTNTAMLWAMVSWRPKSVFDRQSLRTLLRFGISVVVSNTLHRGVANIDCFVVGRWLGTEALGYYTLAFQLAVIPARRLVDLLWRVAFPTFSLVQDDLRRLRSGFLESIQHSLSSLYICRCICVCDYAYHSFSICILLFPHSCSFCTCN